jgi:hypothetical protein
MSGACSELVGSGVRMWPICAHHDQRCRHSVVNACCGVSKMRPRPRGRHPGDGEGDGIAAAQVEGAAAVTAPLIFSCTGSLDIDATAAAMNTPYAAT